MQVRLIFVLFSVLLCSCTDETSKPSAKPYTLHITYLEVRGLQISNPVYTNGRQIGLVAETAFMGTNNDSVLVTLIFDELGYKVSQPSEFILGSDGFLGGRRISIVSDSELKKYYRSGDTAVGRLETDTENLIIPQSVKLKTRSDSMISTIREVVTTLSNFWVDDSSGAGN